MGRTLETPRSTSDERLDRLLDAVAATDDGEPAPREPDLAVGARVAHFEVRAVLGRGGMGVVYLARDERLDRDVALKVLGGASAREGARWREARAASAVPDGRVAHVFEVGEHDGRTFIAMERVPGTNLRVWLAAAPGARERNAVARELCGAVAALHRAGLAHCDLKPENVMIEPQGRVRLIDFGLARTGSGALAWAPAGGTRGYAAPEIAAGAIADVRSDVFSLGVMLDEVLPPGRSRRVRALLSGAVAHSPGDRPSSADLASALVARAPRATVAVLLAVTLAAMLAVAFASRPKPVRRVVAGPSKRLTAQRLDRPISDAAISRDGRWVAWADDGEGVYVAPQSDPAHPRHVDVGETLISISAAAQGWFMVSEAGEQRTVWTVAFDGTKPERWGSGRFRAPSLSPDGEHLVAVAPGDERLVFFKKGGEAPERELRVAPRHICVGLWSPDGRTLAVSETDPAGPQAIRLYDAETFELLDAVSSPRLAQFYSVPVLSWGPGGELLYGLSDAPGQGAGTSVMSSELTADRKLKAAVRLASFERQSLQALSVSATGALLTLRVDARTAAATASLTGDALQPVPLRFDHEYDTRFSSFGSDTSEVYGVVLRDALPTSFKSPLSPRRGEGQGEGRAPGGAATFSTPAWSSTELLRWQTESPQTEGELPWQLMRVSEKGEQAVALPFEVKEPLKAMQLPPRRAAVRCGAGRCVVAYSAGGELELFDLPESGSAVRAFGLTVPGDRTVAFDLSRDGAHVAAAVAERKLERFDAKGTREAEWISSELVWISSVACDAACEHVYFAGVTRQADRFVIIRSDWKSETVLASDGVTQFGDLSVSPDGTTLGLTVRTRDTDVWLNQLDAVP